MNITGPTTILFRAWTLMTGFGLSVNGKHVFCGDYIYSGHTCMLVVCSFLYHECKFSSGFSAAVLRQFMREILVLEFRLISNVSRCRFAQKRLASQSYPHDLLLLCRIGDYPGYDIPWALHS